MRRYQGPPGDETTYFLPRDRDFLDAAWDEYYAAHPERDPSRLATQGERHERCGRVVAYGEIHRDDCEPTEPTF